MCAAREAAYRDLAEHGGPVRIGELTRSGDGLLAFFVDDDYSRVRIVDKVVANQARQAGRLRGYFTTFGRGTGLPAQDEVIHDYVAADDELRVHLGQVVTLTLLMHPAGAVHLTSGMLPRKSLRLARDWVSAGLAKLAPSVRVGPVLVDPEDVRMPKVASLGANRRSPAGRPPTPGATTRSSRPPRRRCCPRPPPRPRRAGSVSHRRRQHEPV